MAKNEQLKYLVASEVDQLWGLFITTVGFQDTAPDTAYPPAGHPSSYWFNPLKGRVLHEYQLIYIVKGEGLFHSAHVKPCRVSAGSLICLFPNEWHTFNPTRETGWQAYWIGFNGEHAEGLKRNEFFFETQAVSNIGFNEQMVSLFEQGIQLAGLQQTGYQQMLAGVTHHLLSSIYYSRKNDSFRGKGIAQQVSKARMMMNTAVFENKTPEEIAGELNISYSWFRRVFKQYTGFSPAQYQLEIKLQKAKEETVKSLSGSGNTFSSDQIPYFGAASVRDVGSGESSWSSVAWFGRLTYSFRDKYLLNGTFRREGNSRFGADNKYGTFPAVSAGWRISKENFMQGISWLNDFKLRGSWGITGNSNIGIYPGTAYMNAAGYTLGGSFVSGQVISSFANSSLRWEKSNQTDLGFDLLAFNGKVSLGFDYYNRITGDMLLPVQLPAIAGFTTTFTNIGKVQNSGYEFTLGYKTNLSRDISVFANGNVSFNNNKVLEIRGENDQLLDGEYYSGFNISRVGRPIGMLYGFQVVRIFNTQAEIDRAPTQDGAIPGVYQYLDANGDGVISYDYQDMVEIGNPTPKVIWGFSTGGTYKNFDMSILLTGAHGYDIYRNIESSTMNMDGIFNVLEDSKLRWRSAQNPGNGKFATSNTWKWARETNSRYVYSGSHVWLKNISLGYALPPSLIKKNSLRLFVSADNLLLITNFPGNNPNVNNRGGINPGQDDEAYPVARTISAGATLTF